MEARLKQLIAEGWFLPEYADIVRSDVKSRAIPKAGSPKLGTNGGEPVSPKLATSVGE